MRGKITRQELHQKLIDELGTHSKFIVSATEPTENLTDGLIWFNPIVEISKIYYNNKFNNFASGGGSGGGGVSTELDVITSRSTLLNKSNKVNINMNSFKNDVGHLEVIANGVRLYPEDYYISSDAKQIIKTSGYWNERGGKTDFLFAYYVSKNMARSATPFLKPVIKQSFYVATGDEVAIPIQIDDFNKEKHKLMVSRNGLELTEGKHFDLNSTGRAIRTLNKIQPLDEFFFWIIDYSDPEYVILLPEGEALKNASFILNNLVIQVTQPTSNLKNYLIWLNPSSGQIKVYFDGQFIELPSLPTLDYKDITIIHTGINEPPINASLWYKII